MYSSRACSRSLGATSWTESPGGNYLGGVVHFSGAYFFHVYAGQPDAALRTHLDTTVLASIDEWIRTRKPGWIFLGMAAVALQLFIGDLQGWFYTAIVAVLLTVSNSLKPVSAQKSS